MENNTNNNRATLIKEIRQKNNLSQRECAKLLKISTNQYIKIEKGQIQPKIEYLDKMSYIFKEDLTLKYFNIHGRKIFITQIFNDIQSNNFSQSELDEYFKDISRTAENIISCEELQQLKTIGEIKNYINKKDIYHLRLVISKATEAIKLTSPKFDLIHFSSSHLSLLELNLLSLSLTASSEINHSEDAMEVLFKIHKRLTTRCEIEDLALEVLYKNSLNLAHLLWCHKRFRDSLEVCRKLLDITEKYNYDKYLPYIYYRIGISLYKINHKKYKDYFNEAIDVSKGNPIINNEIIEAIKKHGIN